MDAFNRFEHIVATSAASVLCYADAERQAFRFLELNLAKTTEQMTQPLDAGWCFAGVVGTDRDGNIQSALNLGTDFAAIARLCEAFSAHIKREWFRLEMETWAALPDTRPDRMTN